MILAALLALAMAASDSAQASTDSDGNGPQNTSDSMSAPFVRIPEDFLNAAVKDSSRSTRPRRTKRQREDAAIGRATLGLLIGMGLAGVIVSSSNDACGLGCMGSGSTLLMVYGAIALPAVFLYFAESDDDAKAQTTPEGIGIRFAFALDPILQEISPRALWRNP